VASRVRHVQTIDMMEIQTTSNEVVRQSVRDWSRMSHTINPQIEIDHRFGREMHFQIPLDLGIDCVRRETPIDHTMTNNFIGSCLHLHHCTVDVSRTGHRLAIDICNSSEISETLECSGTGDSNRACLFLSCLKRPDSCFVSSNGRSISDRFYS
jgi:hypothetical protein